MQRWAANLGPPDNQLGTLPLRSAKVARSDVSLTSKTMGVAVAGAVAGEAGTAWGRPEQ